MTYRVEPLDRDQLDETLRDYVCSTCWSDLTFRYEGGKWYAVCPECGEDTQGYTSKNFAERKRDESESEFFEAERNLRTILGRAAEKQSVERNLSDLGF